MFCPGFKLKQVAFLVTNSVIVNLLPLYTVSKTKTTSNGHRSNLLQYAVNVKAKIKSQPTRALCAHQVESVTECTSPSSLTRQSARVACSANSPAPMRMKAYSIQPGQESKCSNLSTD